MLKSEPEKCSGWKNESREDAHFRENKAIFIFFTALQAVGNK